MSCSIRTVYRLTLSHISFNSSSRLSIYLKNSLKAQRKIWRTLIPREKSPAFYSCSLYLVVHWNKFLYFKAHVIFFRSYKYKIHLFNVQGLFSLVGEFVYPRSYEVVLLLHHCVSLQVSWQVYRIYTAVREQPFEAVWV